VRAPPAPPPVPAPDVAPGQPVWDLGPDTDELVRPHDDPLFSPGGWGRASGGGRHARRDPD
ncbi:hypothetical protein, partial [Mycolicibacillus koreensis]|uniref:hypothetical protein n=1 Tax=Mycolicibacillus koreensis TaxID=1069220 RepID=UPI001A98997E